MTFAHNFLFILSIFYLIQSSILQVDYFIILKALYPMGQPAHLKKSRLLQQFQNFVLNRVFVLILWPIPLESKMSLPTSRVQSKDPILVVIRFLFLSKVLLHFLFFPILTKFMKIFIKSSQTQAFIEPQKRLLKAKTLGTYLEKSYLDYYYFCQQSEDYFKTSSATEINYILFIVSFFYGTISLRWAQHKHYQQNITPIT